MMTIQSIIIKNLLSVEVHTIEGKEVKVGLSYDEVLTKTLSDIKESPFLDNDAQTSINCVRWYASKIKTESTKYFVTEAVGIVRPRKSNKAKKVVETKAVVVKKTAKKSMAKFRKFFMKSQSILS